MRQPMSADELSNDCQGPERAAMLAELGELRLLEGRPDEANKLFQEAFDLQYKGAKLSGSGKAAAAAPEKTPRSEAAARAATQATPAPDTPAAAAPAPADTSPAAPPAASPGSDSDSSASGGWDDPDSDWEPDVTQFRAVRAATTGGLPPAAPASSSSSSSSAARAAQRLTEPGAGRWQSRSWGGAPPARVRGRGESKCGLGSDSDDEPELRANAASLPHIVEVYGLHRGVRSSQLEEFLADFAWGGLGAALRWVDDAHVLAVFPCAEAAQVLLDSPQRSYKVRPYSQASSGSLQVDVEDLAPPRGARPKTTTAVARRLISNALGNREVRDRAAEKELADLRRANKQERQTRQQALAAAWGEDD